MASYRGQNVNLNYGDLELTDELEEALQLLDESCTGGFRATYDIYEGEDEDCEWEAHPSDGPYESLFFVDGEWTEG